MKNIINSFRLYPYELAQIQRFQEDVIVFDRSFGRGNKRDQISMKRDILVGKAGEVGFRRFLYVNFGIKVQLDWAIYEGTKGDTKDFEIHGHRIEVKSIKSGNWLLYEAETVIRRMKQGQLPHYFVLTKVGWSKDQFTLTGNVQILGYVTMEQFLYHRNVIRKGEMLGSTTTPLQVTNYAVHQQDLSHNWSALFYKAKDLYNGIKGKPY